VSFSNGERATMKVPVVADEGDYEGLDGSASSSSSPSESPSDEESPTESPSASPSE
jgi:hypothetical protein